MAEDDDRTPVEEALDLSRETVELLREIRDLLRLVKNNTGMRL